MEVMIPEYNGLLELFHGRQNGKHAGDQDRPSRRLLLGLDSKNRKNSRPAVFRYKGLIALWNSINKPMVWDTAYAGQSSKNCGTREM